MMHHGESQVEKEIHNKVSGILKRPENALKPKTALLDKTMRIFAVYCHRSVAWTVMGKFQH